MTSRSSPGRYGRFAAVALGVLISANGARADVILKYDFSGTLSNAIKGSTSVTATFNSDFTTQAITTFDFTTPVGTIGPSHFFSDLLSLTATTPNADIVELAFTDKGGAGSNLLWLVFESNLASFSTDTSIALYTGLVSKLGVPITQSQLSCVNPAPSGDCSTYGGSLFMSGTATLVVPGTGIPEPASIALLGAGFAGLGIALRRKP